MNSKYKTIKYKENLEWHHDDYMGSSLFHINKELNKMNYKLISTNITGSNAFFVREDLYKKCRTCGQNIKDIYKKEIFLNVFKWFMFNRLNLIKKRKFYINLYSIFFYFFDFYKLVFSIKYRINILLLIKYKFKLINNVLRSFV